jgi:hypothetical protein
MLRFLRRLRKLWWAYTGRCPHCGKKLQLIAHKLDKPTRTGRLIRNFKQCPDAHFAIEFLTRGTVMIHDSAGDKIDILVISTLRIIKGGDESTRDS